MTKLILFFILICTNSVVAQTKNIKIPARIIEVDTLHGNYIAIIQKPNSKKIALTKTELRLIEKLMRESVVEYNLQQTKKGNIENSKIDLKEYKRQYFPYLDKNSKYIEVNCFCQMREDEKWKVDKIEVDDGGNCYFHLIIDLKRKKVIKFYTNGEA